jgi:hypothetical protein
VKRPPSFLPGASRRAFPCLLLCCADPADRQFDGMRRALRELGHGGEVGWQQWDGARPAPAPAGSPEAGPAALVLAGHGSEERAAIGDGRGRSLVPTDLRTAVPPGPSPSAQLYMLACSQGRLDLAASWARGAGLPAASVHGAEAETETLLSTLFVLHLAREGPGALETIFAQWVLANRIIRPFFGPARELYGKTGGDPLAALAWLEGEADLGPVRGFLALAASSTEYLAGLLPAQ